jgi:hypothetical protein
MTSRRQLANACAVLAILGGAAGCGGPRPTALHPDFEVVTSAGIASVSIREPLPGLTDEDSVRVLRAGMARIMPVSSDQASMAPPFPQRRIVWHVEPTSGRGTSRVIVNIFDGSVPVAYEQDVVDNDVSTTTLTFTIESLTRRLLAKYSKPQ